MAPLLLLAGLVLLPPGLILLAPAPGVWTDDGGERCAMKKP